jgi:hypothetical protein
MSELERHIIFAVALLLLATTGSRFIIQELIALVRLCKELKAEFHRPLPASHEPEGSPEASSKNGSAVPVRKISG